MYNVEESIYRLKRDCQWLACPHVMNEIPNVRETFLIPRQRDLTNSAHLVLLPHGTQVFGRDGPLEDGRAIEKLAPERAGDVLSFLGLYYNDGEK